MIQQRNKIIAELYNSKDFNDCINKMEPEHLREDLKQEVMVVLLGKEPAVICGLDARGELRWYVVGVILNMVRSNSSNFTKMYRRTYSNVIPELPVKELNGRVHKEFTEQAILRYIQTELYWYDRTIVQMYMKFGNYRAIQTETKIPWESCYKTVRRVVDKVRKEVLNAPE